MIRTSRHTMVTRLVNDEEIDTIGPLHEPDAHAIAHKWVSASTSRSAILKDNRNNEKLWMYEWQE